MPRAPHGVADHQAVGKRAMIMSAVCAYCKELVTSPRQNDVITADAAGDHSTIGKILE
jgi:hypothetical protein